MTHVTATPHTIATGGSNAIYAQGFISLTAGDTIAVSITTNGNSAIEANSAHFGIHCVSF